MKKILFGFFLLGAANSFAGDSPELKKCYRDAAAAVGSIYPFVTHMDKLENEMIKAHDDWVNGGDEALYNEITQKKGDELQELNKDILTLAYKSCVAIQ